MSYKFLHCVGYRGSKFFACHSHDGVGSLQLCIPIISIRGSCQGFDVSEIGLLCPILCLACCFHGFSRTHLLSTLTFFPFFHCLKIGGGFLRCNSCFLPSIFTFQLPSSTKCFSCSCDYC